MRRLLPLLILPLLCAPARAAQPVDRFQKQIDAGRYADVATAARKWLDKNAGSEQAAEVSKQLAEAEYQRLRKAPTLPAVQSYRAEFPESTRGPDLDLLELNLSLYAAARSGTVAAYREVAETWPGTAAATEAMQRAEALAFEVASADGTAPVLARFLGDYEDMAHEAEALELWRVAAWDEALASETSVAWRELRMADPEHPRTDEALGIESGLALAELPEDASAKARLRVARRYEGTPSGWVALQGALARSTLTAEGVAGPAFDGLLGDEGPLPLPAVHSLVVAPPGRLPASASLSVLVEASADGTEWMEWRRASFRQAARWGVQGDPLGEEPELVPGTLALRPPLCRGDTLAQARLVVSLKQGDEEASWTRPLDASADCGGPLPVAVQRSEGRVTALSSLSAAGSQTALPAPQARILAQPLLCEGALAAGHDGLWLSCGALLVQPHAQGSLVRSGALPPALESAYSPWLDSLKGEGWSSVDVPDAWHFGGRASCPGERGAAVPSRPEFVDPSIDPTARDADGDGTDDLLFAVGDELVLASSRLGGAAWVSGAPGEGATLSFDGCGIAWVLP